MNLDDLNFLFQGCSGKMGNRVYYQRWGKTLNRKRVRSYNIQPTSQQAPVRSLFKKAVLFGKAVLADPQLKESYAARAIRPQNAYTLAVSEYMKQHSADSTQQPLLREQSNIFCLPGSMNITRFNG